MGAKPFSDLSRKEAVALIKAIGQKVTLCIQGETGTGKSTILRELAGHFKSHIPIYCDLTTKDTGDMAMPKMKRLDTGQDILEFVPNAELGLHLDRPVILMWDELGKAPRPVLNACLRVLLEGKMGNFALPEGSIQFATTNLAEEGLGDVLPPHVRNRIAIVTMRKPNKDEWVQEFAIDAGIHPTILASLEEFPMMLESYRQYTKPGENPYVFDPRKPTPSFVTPRSLEKASHILKATETMDSAVRTHALSGVVGERAAADMMSIDVLHDQLPKWAEIIAKPEKVKVPTSAAAVCLLVYNAVSNIDSKSVAPFMTYVKRLPTEAQALFASSIVRTTKAAVVTGEKLFLEWAKEHKYLYSPN